MRRNFHYIQSLWVPAMAYVAVGLGGWWGLLPWVVVFGVVALIEAFLPENTDNSHDEDKALPAGILWMHWVAHLGLLGYWLWQFYRGAYQPWEAILSSLAVGFSAGASGIVVAHEMLHRKGRLWQAGAKSLLAAAGNPYFYVTHVRMHHRYVGTELDYSSARRGESFYAFLARTVPGQLRWAWRAEKERLTKQSRSPLSFRNYVLQHAAGTLLGVSLFAGIGGLWGASAFLLQALVANFLLEYVNYIEHYGLARRIEEPIRPWHSWESNKYFSRFFLVDLSRHADHHLHGAKSYHTLNALERAPRLPTGYAGMIYLALIPPLWRRVMDKRLPAVPA
ncbi:MAG: alkane 1-monooxygenase [Bacteroidia bacterium]|jgi:alkane 1-monooxygenase|nr:alkane 1-monooxygenase [Bacteroidia bacterium]GIV23434.1 MAG: alkane 1-monooxygenase [Bacteroidia bacterium]